MASRLSEAPRLNVVLMEAGRDTPPGQVPADITDIFPRSYSNPEYVWPGLLSSYSVASAPRAYSQARIMGGGSSLMGMWALRGLAADYERWREAGGEGWGWRDIAPCFDRLENDPLHGRGGGPVAIRRIEAVEWPSYIRAMQRAAQELGYPLLPDINGTEADGFFGIPLSQDGGSRVSSASAYLPPEVRRRPNLRVMANTEAMRVEFEGRRAVGVAAAQRGATVFVRAREVILSAGAVQSPVLLMRSGIGDADALGRLGIGVVADVPAVGRNLQNHVCINIGLTLPAGQRQSRELCNYGVACMRVSSGLPGASPADLLLAFIGRTSMRPVGRSVAIVGIFLYDPLSRGRVELERTEGQLQPHVHFDQLSELLDCARLAHGLRLALKLFASPGAADAWQEAFLLPAALPLNRLNKPGVLGATQGIAGLAALGSGAWMRRRVVRSAIGDVRFFSRGDTQALSTNELEAQARDAATPMFHVAGTCAMGAVVDNHCKVLGVQGLRVVDASIMPRVPRANTNLPAMMVAERAAELFKDS